MTGRVRARLAVRVEEELAALGEAEAKSCTNVRTCGGAFCCRQRLADRTVGRVARHEPERNGTARALARGSVLGEAQVEEASCRRRPPTSAFTTPPMRVAMPPAITQNASSPRASASRPACARSVRRLGLGASRISPGSGARASATRLRASRRCSASPSVQRCRETLEAFSGKAVRGELLACLARRASTTLRAGRNFPCGGSCYGLKPFPCSCCRRAVSPRRKSPFRAESSSPGRLLRRARRFARRPKASRPCGCLVIGIGRARATHGFRVTGRSPRPARDGTGRATCKGPMGATITSQETIAGEELGHVLVAFVAIGIAQSASGAGGDDVARAHSGGRA